MGTITLNRQWRLTDNQYFKEHTDKINICLHHTVGGSARSTFNWWQSNPDRIATSYIIGRDGTIYEVFDPSYWAYHLGLKMAKNVLYNERTIGIELASEGALRSGKELNDINNSSRRSFDEEWLYAFDIYEPPFKNAKKLVPLIDMSKYYQHIVDWRGFMFFDVYDEPQVIATIALVNHLCEQFNIPKQLIPNENKLAFDTAILTDNWSGIFTHANVRTDKTDLSPAWDWTRLNDGLI